MEFALDLATHPAAAAPAGHRDGAVRPRHARPLARSPQSPRTILTTPAGPGGRARLRRAGRHRAGVHRLPRPPTRTPGRSGYRDLAPVNQYNVDYSILGTSRVEPLLREHPQRDVRRGDGRRVGQGRVQPRPARDRLPLRRRPDHRRQPRRLQDRGQGDRRPAREVADLHGQVRRARGQLLPHPPLAPRGRRRDGRSGTSRARRADARSTTTSSPGCWRPWPTSPCSTRRTSTPTSGSPPARSRRRRSPGARTTAPARVRLVGHGKGARVENRVPGGDVNPYLALAAMLAGGLHGIEHELELPAGADGQRLHVGPADGAAYAAPGPGRLRRLRGRPRGASATRSSTTTPTWPTSSWPPSTPPSPTGSCAAASRGCEPDLRDLRRCRRPGDRAARRRRRDGRPGPRPTPRSRRAAAAAPAWRAVAPGERARLLRRFAAVVDEHLEELARLEVRNAGHTIGNARWEAGNVRDVLNYYSATPERLFGRQIPVPGGIDVTFHEPLGVVGIIVPWNFPMPIAAWGFAPALAAGNTVVLKPAELHPADRAAARRAGAARPGCPSTSSPCCPGAGPVVGAAVRHPPAGPQGLLHRLDRRSASRCWRGCAEQVKRCTLELGGKSANIVFADADLAKAAAAAPSAVFDNAGQDCCARSRILVQESVHDGVPRPAAEPPSRPSWSPTRPTRPPRWAR